MVPLSFLHPTFFSHLSPAVKRIQAHLPCVFEEIRVSGSRDISRDEASCGVTDVVSDLLKKNSFAYHAESQLSKVMSSSEYFD